MLALFLVRSVGHLKLLDSIHCAHWKLGHPKEFWHSACGDNVKMDHVAFVGCDFCMRYFYIWFDYRQFYTKGILLVGYFPKLVETLRYWCCYGIRRHAHIWHLVCCRTGHCRHAGNVCHIMRGDSCPCPVSHIESNVNRSCCIPHRCVASFVIEVDILRLSV